MDKLTAVDLFCGAGGVSAALKEHFKILCSVEFDPIIAKTYSLNHTDKHLLQEDIRNISDNRWIEFTKLQPKELDILVGTPPCQGFSKHSRKKTNQNKDQRNKLVMQVLRVANILQPKFIFFENVENIKNYEIFHCFLKALVNLNKDGSKKINSRPSYHLRFETVNAIDYGVPQIRKRLILIGKRIDEYPEPKAVLIETFSNPEIFEPLNIWPLKRKASNLKEYFKQFQLSKISAGQTDPNDSLHSARRLSDLNLKRIKATSHNGGSRDSWPENLILDCHKKKNISFGDVYGRMNNEKYAPTITCGCTCYSKGRFGHPTEDRAISLREAALIQTFPIDYCFTGSLTGTPNQGSKEKISTQIGNAVPVNLAKAFIEEIAHCLLIEKKSNILKEEKSKLIESSLS